MNPQSIAPKSPVQDNSLLQQGYLQVVRNGEAQKVFAVLTPKNLLIYSEDPTKYQNAELSTSIDIAKSKLLEEGNFKRPKSFGVFSDQNFLEFSCATNSSRLSWLKSFNNAKESADSLQKLKGIKATMDLYRAPTVVGRSNPAPIPTSSLASSPNHESILRSKFSGGSKNLFGDTFSQLRSLDNAGSLPPQQPTQQQLHQPQQQQQQLQQPHVSFSTPNLIAQPKLKKNIVAKPSTIGKSTSNSQQNETKELPRWIPGNYKVPGQTNNNRSVTPQKVSQPPHQAHSGYRRAASAPNRRPNEKSHLNQNNQILFTPVGAPNLYATGASSEYSSLPGKPLSINTLQHNQQQVAHQHLAQQHQSFQSQASYQQSSYKEYLPHQQQQHPTNSLHNYQLPPNNSQYSTNIPPTYYNGNMASFPQPSPAATGPNAMEHLTLAQIRAALMSIPVPIRSALMNEDIVPSTNKVQHIDRSQSIGNRDDIVRSNNNRNRPQHRAPPTKEISDDDSSSLDSGYIASGGKANKPKAMPQRSMDDNVNKHHHNHQPYEEEEMLGATTYSDSHFQMRSRQLYEDNDKEEEGMDINNDDANGYGMANIYSNGGSPDEKYVRDDTDLAVSARSNPMLKSQSLRRDSMLKSNSMQVKTSTDATMTKKMLLEQGKRPNPLQRSKSAPITRPSASSVSISQQLQRSKSPANNNAMTNSNIRISADKGLEKDVRDSILTWSKRQARDKRIGMNYFGNTKKGVQLMQSQGITESPSNSASPQRRVSTTDVPVVAFSKPLALRKTPTQSTNQDISNKLGNSQLGKPLKTTTPSAGPKSFFEFKKSSKTVDAAVSQHPEATIAGNMNSTPMGKQLQPQQKENLELQLLKYQQGLQRKRQEGAQQGLSQPQTKPSLIPTLSQQPPVASLTVSTGQVSGMQQKWQLDYAAKRQALFTAPPSSRPKPVVPPLANFSRSTSYQSTPTTRPNRSESYESALYNNSHVEDEEITDKAESHRFRSWLESIDMDHYLSTLRDNGVNKLSLLELLTGNDLAQIGIPELDATIILEKARELTERIKSFSENVDIKDWNTISITNGVSSSKLATPTSISRRKESYGTQSQKIPESPSAIPLTLERIIELKSKLVEAYKGGELDKFFMLWERLPSFPQSDPKFKSPDLNALLRAERPALVMAKQAMEFHLHLYFFVYSLKYLSSSKISVLKAKSALRKYLDKIASSQQEDPSAPNSPFKVSSPLSSAQALHQLNASMDPSTSPVNTSFEHMSARNLFATKEFATFAGLVFVPNPQTNPAFQSLFREEWSVALLERLQKFLDAAFPNDETKTVNKESTAKVENNDIGDQEKIVNEPTKSPVGVNLDGINEIIRPAPIRPATDVSVSIHSGNASVKKTTMSDIFMSPPQQEPETTPQVTSAESQKLIAKVPSLSSSFESPPPQPPLSAQSIRSQTVVSQQPPLPVQELPSTVGLSPTVPAPPINAVQPSPHQEPDNVMDPSPAKVLLEEEIGNEVILLDGNREACISPASSISQLTDDTPLNRVSASLNGQATGSTGYSQQHTMNAWLQNSSQPTTVAGTRPQRIKVSLASPSQTANNQSNNRKSPGAGMGIPPTTVLMPLNQRNLLSIQQQQQLQQFQQQFGYSPISPGGSRVSGGRSSGNNNNLTVNNANLTGGSQMEKMLDITIDQLDISPMGSPPQAQQNVKQLSVPTEEVATAVAAQNQVKPDAPKSMSSPSMQNTRPKTVSNQSSSKSSLQSQVDSYNRLLKMKKLSTQSAPLTPSTTAAPATTTSIDAPQASQQETSSENLEDKMPITVEVSPIKQVVPSVQESDVAVDYSQDMEEAAGVQNDLVISNDGKEEIPETTEWTSAVPNEESNLVEDTLPVISHISAVNVQNEGVISAESTPLEASNTEQVEIIVHEAETPSELPQEDIVPVQVDEVDIQAAPSVEPTKLEPSSSPLLEVTSNETEVQLVTIDSGNTDNSPSDKLNNEETFPETAEVIISSTVIEELPETSPVLPTIPDVTVADISTKLDTSAFSIDNVVASPSNGLEPSSQPVSTNASSVEDTTVSQQAAKYKVLLRNNQKKKKKGQSQQH